MTEKRSRRLGRLRLAAPLIGGMFALGALIGCQSPGAGGLSGASAGTVADVAGPSFGDADEFLVVDCLLPAQVRRLGRQLTYLGAQRAIRTAAVECEIRGGEYVAYDRANYDTALKVWLQPAMEGDAQAQNYVGEIFERGLGRAPDYAMAAEWYRRAAEQGFAPAQINLGQLYEQGLGVPRDQIAAINWYRRASGFEEAGLSFVVSSDVANELTDLRESVMLQESDAERLRNQIKSLEREMAQLETARRAAEDRASQAPTPVAETPPTPAAQGPDVAAALAEIERARAELQAEREAVEEQRRLAEQAAGELQGIEASLEAERQALIAKERELEAQRAEGVEDQQARAEVDQLLQDLALKQIEFQRRSDDLAARDALLAEREQRAAQRAADIQELEAKIAEREQVLAQREEAIVARQGELSELDRKIAALQQTFEEQRSQLARLSRDQTISLAGPEIQLIDPELPLTRSSLPVVWTRPNISERPVIGRVEAPAGLLSLLLNDRPLTVGDNNLFEGMVPLSTAGTKVSVVAVDRQGKRGATEFMLRPETQTAALGAPAPEVEPAAAPSIPPINFGNYHALVIGINDYTHIPKLETAINDAETIGKVLAERYGFQVQMLRNPNRYQILSALNQLRAQLTSEDNLLIYYAGHGELDQTNQRGHWLPVDAEADSDANWISNISLTDILNTMSARQIMVIADSCYSGALTRTALTQLETGMTENERLVWLKTMAAKKSRTALTSGGLAPVLDGGGGDHSVFAKALIDSLATNRGVMEGQRLYQQVAARVAYIADQVRFEQLPQYAPIKHTGHEAGDFFFVAKAAATS